MARQFTFKNVSRIANYVTWFKESREGGKTAIVSPRDLEFGIGRMFDTFGEIKNVKFEIRVFRNLPAAREWLGEDNIPANDE